MQRIGRFLSDVAEFGGLFFQAAFEHPDYRTYCFLAQQENLYAQKLITHNRTMNVLKNMNAMQTGEQVAKLHQDYNALSAEIYNLDEEIEREMLKHEEAGKSLDKEFFLRKATLMLNEQDVKVLKLKAVMENMEICNVLESNKINLEQIARVNKDVMTNTTFDAETIRKEGETVRELLSNHTRVAIATSDVLRDIKSGAKELAYHHNDKDVRLLTSPVGNPESKHKRLHARLLAIREAARLKDAPQPKERKGVRNLQKLAPLSA